MRALQPAQSRSSWLQRVRNAISAMRGAAPASPRDSSLSGFTDLLAALGGQEGVPWAVETTRLAIHQDIERMIDTDPNIPTGFDIWADWITAPAADESETLILETENETVEGILRDMFARTELSDEVWQFAHGLKAYGNEFVENVIGPIDSGLGIVELKELPEEQIFRQTDRRGRLGYDNNGKEVAPYVQRLSPYVATGRGDVEFARWQITHFVARPIRRGGYGTAQMASARRIWKALQLSESSLFIARAVRAYLKLVHHVPIPLGQTPAQIKERMRDYKQGATRTDVIDTRGTDRRPTDMMEAMSVDRDWFMPKFYRPDGGVVEGKVELIDPKNEQLGKLEDIEYAQNQVLVRLGVPKALLGLERDVNAKATLTEQGRQFARRVRAAQVAMAKGLREICDLELLLHGIVPAEAEYAIQFPAVNVRDEEMLAAIGKLRAETAAYLAEQGAIDNEAIRSHYTDLTPDEAQEIADRIEATPPPPPPPPQPTPPALPPPSEGVQEWVNSGEAAAELLVVKSVLENRFGFEFGPDDGEPE